MPASRPAPLPARDRLLRALEHARRAVPHYAGLGPLPDRADDVNLARLPLLTRGTLRREKARLLAAGADNAGWQVARTTGTTGEPVEVVRVVEARAAEAAVLARHVDACLGSGDWRRADLLHVTLRAGATSRAEAAPWGPARAVKWNLLPAWQAGDARFLAALMHLDGVVVTAMPSVAELLARRLDALAPAARPSPRLVLLSGETVEPEAAARAGAALGCPVTAVYALAETGIVGTACRSGGGYHVEDEVAVIEIADNAGTPVDSGATGEVLVTTLANLAMPLVRYRTEDRGAWDHAPCGCGRPGPRLRLFSARRPARLAAAGGFVNVVRFAKTLAALPVEQVRLDQAPDGAVRVVYRAARALDEPSTALVKACLRATVGPEPAIRFERVPADAGSVTGAWGGADAPVPLGAAEPAGRDVESIARWLGDRLEREHGIAAAVISGSSLDVEATTRFSDIDLVLLVTGAPRAPAWLGLCRALRASVPRLAVAVDLAEGLPRRAPLLTSRLLAEQLPVRGRVDAVLLSWPDTEDLRSQGRFWVQETGAALWQRLTTAPAGPFDPVREAWVAGKLALDALRYRYLARGERATAARHVLELAHDDRWPCPWLADLVAVLEVAREHRPPPLSSLDGVVPALATALACVAQVAEEL